VLKNYERLEYEIQALYTDFMPKEESDSDFEEADTFTSRDLRDKTFFFKRHEKTCTE
jgi:hypothetical protein